MPDVWERNASRMTETEWKTLRVPKDAYEEAKAQKEEHNRTWGEQIVRGHDPEQLTKEDVERIIRRLVVGDALR